MIKESPKIVVLILLIFQGVALLLSRCVLSCFKGVYCWLFMNVGRGMITCFVSSLNASILVPNPVVLNLVGVHAHQTLRSWKSRICYISPNAKPMFITI